MRIEGELNLSLISESLADKATSIENRLMNFRFCDNTERLALSSKLKRIRSLHNHINRAALSELISNTIVIQN